jgi:hypothetical protein
MRKSKWRQKSYESYLERKLCLRKTTGPYSFHAEEIFNLGTPSSTWFNEAGLLALTRHFCVHSHSFLTTRPYKQNHLPSIASWNNFFHLWQDKKYVITPTALCNMHTAEWAEFNGTERLEFAQMPTAGDEVEAALRWEALASTVRAPVIIVSAVRYCEVGVRRSAWVASIISCTLQS